MFHEEPPESKHIKQMHDGIVEVPLSCAALPPVLCQGRRMDVRRGVFRCSSR